MPPNASEPESGSVMAHAAIFSSVISSGSQRSFCASVPRLMMVAAPRPRLTDAVLSNPMLTRAISDTNTAIIDPCAPPPKPPESSGFSSGTSSRCSPFCLARSRSSIFLTDSAAMASRPNWLNSLRTIGYGDISPVSNSSRCGRISLSTNCRTALWTIRSVSDHSIMAPLTLGALVGGDDGGAAQPDVVLQCGADVVDLTLVGCPAQLPGQFGALRQAGGAQRVPLGDQAAGRVDHPATPVGGVVVVDQLR